MVQGVVVMSDGERLQQLASLVGQRNSWDARIAEALGRPALSGHFGEYVASIVFGIELHSSAAQRGSDGVFTSGVLAGRRVEIKYYPMNEGLLDLKVDGGPDFYLVMTGPRKAAGSSRGEARPWVIEAVYLFDGVDLVGKLWERGRKIGTATSVRRELWDEAEVYPKNNNPMLAVNADQAYLLGLFRGSSESG